MNPTLSAAMTCLEFRRAKLAEPGRLSDAAEDHLASCPACLGFSRRIDHNEQRVMRTLNVPVPEGLEERMLLAVHNRHRLPWRSWALAASVLLTVGLGINLWNGRNDYDAAGLAIAHVMHEPESFTDKRLASAEEFRAVLAHFGGEMKQSLGTVRYMKLCPGPEGAGWHVVLQTAGGQVSLFLIPGKSIRTTAEQERSGWVAVAAPAGRGYYAIVADSEPALAAFSARMREAVSWRA